MGSGAADETLLIGSSGDGHAGAGFWQVLHGISTHHVLVKFPVVLHRMQHDSPDATESTDGDADLELVSNIAGAIQGLRAHRLRLRQRHGGAIRRAILSDGIADGRGRILAGVLR